MIPVLIWLDERTAEIFQKRCRMFPDTPSRIILREMARVGEL